MASGSCGERSEVAGISSARSVPGSSSCGSSNGGSASCGRCSVRDALREKLPWRTLSSSASICSRSVSVRGAFREWRSARSSLYVLSVKARLLLVSEGLNPCRACFRIGRACHTSNLGGRSSGRPAPVGDLGEVEASRGGIVSDASRFVCKVGRCAKVTFLSGALGSLGSSEL